MLCSTYYTDPVIMGHHLSQVSVDLEPKPNACHCSDVFPSFVLLCHFSLWELRAYMMRVTCLISLINVVRTIDQTYKFATYEM